MLVLLQFDSASLPVIERMLEDGRLPALAALKERGQWSSLDADTDMFEAGTFPTLYTGHGVAEHGMYYPFVWSAEEQRVRYMDRFPIPDTIWERLAKAGRRSLIVDPYQLWVTREQTGFSVSGWQFRHNIIPRWAKPSATYHRLVRDFGSPPKLNDVAGERTAAGLLEMRSKILEGPGRAASATIELLKRESFDFVWITFIGSHQAGHHLWDLTFAEPSIDAASRKLLETGLESVYAEIDKAIQRIVDALPASADVIAFSSLGMGPNTTRSDMLPEMLKAVLGKAPASNGATDGAGSSIWRFRAAVPAGFRSAVASAMPGDMIRETVGRLYFRGVDWTKTPAFVLPGDHFGNIRLNVRGREREGVIPPDQVDSLLDELTDGLASFNDPDGSPCIAGFERVAGQFIGPRVENFPDLVLRWSDRPAAAIRRVVSPRFGEVQRRSVGTGRSGNHAPGTWAILAPGSSKLRRIDRTPQIMDFAATACAILDVDRSELSGEPLFGSHVDS
jgi:predicted AlkP superfamily phosphohydrolase/phosphomutase